jgi:acetyl/propionyl-CoA carboxylase alpha subunit
MSGPSLHGKWKVDGGATRRVDVKLDASPAGARLHGRVDDVHVEGVARRGGDGEVLLDVGGRRVRATVARAGDRWLVAIGGRVHEVVRADAADAVEGGPGSDPFAVSPMTGLVTKVHVAAGAAVVKGAPLFAVEAMKMEYVVRADRDVVVTDVKATAGDRVAVGTVIVTFTA